MYISRSAARSQYSVFVTMFPQTLSLFAIAACVSARVQPRLLDRIVINGPTGSAGQTFETSLDNGVSWKAGADSMPLDAQSVVGFRKANEQASAVIVKVSQAFIFPVKANPIIQQNALPAGTNANTWLTVENAGMHPLP
jgi:hypothetical protein